MLNPTSKYKRDYKNLDSQTQKRVDDVLRVLSQAEYPKRLGRHKIHDLECVYGYDIGSRYRILYDIKEEANAIVLYRVGLHKIYYP